MFEGDSADTCAGKFPTEYISGRIIILQTRICCILKGAIGSLPSSAITIFFKTVFPKEDDLRFFVNGRHPHFSHNWKTT
jgi:hypothetical protein